MNQSHHLIQRLNQLVATKAWKEAYEAAEKLWDCPSYKTPPSDPQLLETYIHSLFTVAELLRSRPENYVISPYGVHRPIQHFWMISTRAVAAMKRVYSIDDGHVPSFTNASAKEAAANKLGILYEDGGYHNTAVWWFGQALSLARATGEKKNMLLNLHGLARNFNTLANFREAGPCYDEMLHILEDMPPSRSSVQARHAAMYQVQHGDEPRGEAIMRGLIEAVLVRPSSADLSEPVPTWFAGALHALGTHYIATERAGGDQTGSHGHPKHPTLRPARTRAAGHTRTDCQTAPAQGPTRPCAQRVRSSSRRQHHGIHCLSPSTWSPGLSNCGSTLRTPRGSRSL